MLMPRLSESMRDEVIVRWLRDPGTRVEPGEELVEIETDKATVTVESESAGVLEILAAEGETRDVGSPIARIGGPSRPDGAVRFKASPLARRLAGERGVDLAGLTGTGPGGRVVRADIEAAAAGRPATNTSPRGAVTVVEPSHAQRTVALRMAEAARTIP